MHCIVGILLIWTADNVGSTVTNMYLKFLDLEYVQYPNSLIECGK